MTPAFGTTRAEAWLDAAQKLQASGGTLYNLVVEVEKPDLATPQSRAIEARIDNFLTKYGCQPIHTVAETIFPAEEYRSGGLKKVYEYPETIFPHIQSIEANRKGTYALRLVQRQKGNGAKINPLEILIDKLCKQVAHRGPMRAVYELDLCVDAAELKFYDYEVDFNNYRSGQCLSHVSLKLGPERELYLTAMYRYQYFVQKAVGNFKGLARLQDCIAREVGIPVGPLVCHATLATLESENGWNKSGIAGLIADCKTLAASQESEDIAA